MLFHSRKTIARMAGSAVIAFAVGGAGEMPATESAHNTWAKGKAMPTARVGMATGVIGNKIYVVTGATSSELTSVNEIYDPTTHKWSTGASIPTARYVPASAVVNGILYVIGGKSAGNQLTAVEAYDAAANTWSTVAPLPIAVDSAVAVTSGGKIYVIGGYRNGAGRLSSVYVYDPTADNWAQAPSLLVGKSLEAAGAAGGTIVAAGGLANSGVTEDTERFSTTKNTWANSVADPTARQAGCAGLIKRQLYVAGGDGSSATTPLNTMESYNLKTAHWSSLAPIPKAVVIPGSAVVGGRLYCIGGSITGTEFGGAVYDDVQIYRP